MIGDIPIVSFDTSTHNELVKDGPRAEIVLAGLKSGLSFRFVGLSIDEMVADSDPAHRAALFAYCSRIQDGLSECIYPHNELTKRMVIEHHKNPSVFNWKTVDVKARDEKGQPVEFRAGGLLARAVQHEADHLNGILFIDRMERSAKEELRDELEALQAATKAALEAARKKK